MPLDNSPYYIRTTNNLPEVLPAATAPWLVRLRGWFNGFMPNFSYPQITDYEKDGNSGQIVASDDTYATKLQAEWHRGTRSNDINDSTVTPQGWFPWPVGGATGRQDRHGAQPQGPAGTPIGNNQNQAPLPSRYGQLSNQNHPDCRSTNIQSIAEWDHGPAPWRVPLARKPGISLMAGDAQFSTQQYAAGMVSSVVVAPPIWSNPTRGARSVSGIFGRVQSPGRTRVPAVYVPTQVR